MGRLPRRDRAARCRRRRPTTRRSSGRASGCSAEEIDVKGDWAVKRPHLDPAGWAFEFANDLYPDIDDTAEVVLALRRVGEQVLPGVEAAIERGIRWTIGMQSRDGGWGAFDADNTRRIIEKLPFCDFGAVIDPPSADVTAHVVEMLGRTAAWPTREPGRRGVRWLLDAQESDGSWFGRWGANYVYGTGAAVPALVAAGIAPRLAADPARGDAGSRSTRTPTAAGARTCAPTATTLARPRRVDRVADRVGAAGPARRRRRHRCGRRAASAWLVETQRADGGWDEDLYTGTGFPGDFYINYEMYRLVFPLSALGRYQSAVRGGPS